jgi:protein TonB
MTADPIAPEGRDAVLWSAAALIVAIAHVGVVAAFMLLRPMPEERAAAPTIDVAFMPATSLPSQAAPEAQPAEPTPPVEQPEPAARQAVVEPEPQEKVAPVLQPEPAPPPVALAIPEPLPPAAPIEQPTAALPPPLPPEPAARPSRAEKPAATPERITPKPAGKDKAEKQKEKKETERRKAAQQTSLARTASAPNESADSEGSRAGQASWNSELAAHIRRYATYPNGSSRESGTVQVSVTIDRNGRLLSHRIAGSSGSPVLDRAALASIERAQPYPRFPAGMTQAQASRTIPLHLRPQ